MSGNERPARPATPMDAGAAEGKVLEEVMSGRFKQDPPSSASSDRSVWVLGRGETLGRRDLAVKAMGTRGRPPWPGK